MKIVHRLLLLLLQMGYFGPLVMGVLDSSFLVLPFGNDLVVVAMVAKHHDGAVWYVLSAALGSTLGVLLLVLASRKLGEEGIRRLAGGKRYETLKSHISRHGGIAIVIGGLAPPPFPFTMVIAAAAALRYPLWRLVLVNFFTRAARFALVAYLAIRFGRQVMRFAKSTPFEWGMTVFIALCLIASAFSIWRWLRKPGRAKR